MITTMPGSIARVDLAAPLAENSPTPHELLMLSQQVGLVTNKEILSVGVRLQPAGRSHPVYRLIVGGEDRAILKSFGASRGETDGSIECERAVATLSTDRQAIAAAIPAPLPWPPGNNAIATQFVVGQAAWAADSPGGGKQSSMRAWQSLVDAVVPLLAGVHLSTRDLARDTTLAPEALKQNLPWAVRLYSGDTPPELWADNSLRSLLSHAGQNAAAVEGLHRARMTWRPMCLVHGDLKHDNVLLVDDGSVRIIDWEMARIGDPAWDLAGLASRLPALDSGAREWSANTLDGVALLINAYSKATPIGTAGLVTRLPLYVGAWLLMGAIQASSLGNDKKALMAMVDCACHTLASHRSLSEQLGKCLC